MYKDEAHYLAEKREWDQMDRTEKSGENKPYPPEERFNESKLNTMMRIELPDLIGPERDIAKYLVMKLLRGEKIQRIEKTEVWDCKIDISKYRKAFMDKIEARSAA
jgi:hypothetical protein